MLYLAPDDLDLKSSLEGGGPRSGGGCLFQRRASRVRDEERVRETGEREFSSSRERSERLENALSLASRSTLHQS